MAGRRTATPRAERTPVQVIESGYKLTASQKDTYALWDQEILLLKLKGRTPEEIAVKLGCSVQHVRKRTPILLTAKAKEMAELAEQEIVMQIGTLDLLLSEVRQQWERSCKDKEETMSETEGGGEVTQGAGGQPTTLPSGRFKQITRTNKATQTGDPRLIEQIRAILADKRRLLRLDKDDTLKDILERGSFTQININSNNGPMVPITAMTPQALAETAELLAALGMNPDGTPLKRLPEPDVIEGEFSKSDDKEKELA